MEKTNKEDPPSSWVKYFYCIANNFTRSPRINKLGNWTPIWYWGFTRHKNTNIYGDILHDFWGFYLLLFSQFAPLEENLPIYSQGSSYSHLNYWYCSWVCSPDWVYLWEHGTDHIRSHTIRETYALLYLLTLDYAEAWWNLGWPLWLWILVEPLQTIAILNFCLIPRIPSFIQHRKLLIFLQFMGYCVRNQPSFLLILTKKERCSKISLS